MTPGETAALMAEILEIDEISHEQTFFEVGGNSFLTLTLIARIQERAGVQLRLIDILGRPTPVGVSDLVARALTAKGGAVA
jgi:acyl carrier protein